MRYKGEFIKLNGIEVNQVNINTARKRYATGKIIFIHPANTTLFNCWITPMQIEKVDPALNETEANKQFNVIVNSYSYYNCIPELGKYPIFFTN